MRLGWLVTIMMWGAFAAPWRGAASDGGAAAPLSALGEAVWQAGGDRWVQARGRGVTVHAFSQEQATNAAGIAARALRDFQDYWEEKPVLEEILIYIVADDALWNRLVQDQEFRPDSLALELGREIFIKGGGGDALVARIPHEIVHYVLHQRYGRKMPLWLEEGLALQVGHVLTRQQAADYQEKDGSGRAGLAFWRKRVDLDWVVAQERYPVEPGEARMYYRAIRNLVHEIEAREGRAKLREFTRSICGEGLTFEQAARKVLGWTIYDIKDVQNKLLARPSD